MGMDALPTPTRNACANGAVDLVDAGSGAGKLVILTAGDAVLVTFTLSDPGFGNAGASVAGRADGASMPKTATASGSGTAAKCKLVDSDDTVVGSGDAGTSGTIAIIDNATIVAGQTVNLTALTWTQPAS